MTYTANFDYTYGTYMICVEKSTLEWHFCIHGTELMINFQDIDYIVNEGDQEGSIVMRLREVQNSFTMTLYPVTITEARDPAGRFDVSPFVTSVHAGAEATPGKEVISRQNSLKG